MLGRKVLNIIAIMKESQSSKKIRLSQNTSACPTAKMKTRVSCSPSFFSVFMDMNTYDQFELEASVIGDNAKFLKEGLDVESMTIEGEIVGISLPEKVSYKVISAPDAVKGNTTSGAQKDVTIETGYELKAPLFISEGDEIVITTRDGKYFSRG